jgi:hypothetical protein
MLIVNFHYLGVSKCNGFWEKFKNMVFFNGGRKDVRQRVAKDVALFYLGIKGV